MSVQRTVVSMLTAGAALSLAVPVHAICREVTERNSSRPAIDPEQEVLFVERTNWPIGLDCSAPPAPDAGPSDDAGTPDAGVPDAGTDDAGAGDGDGGTPDAGPSCATIYGDAITMVVQPRFFAGEGGSHFALLMVTPAAPVVELAAANTFDRLRAGTVAIETTTTTYVEDSSLGYQCHDPAFSGGGCGGSSYSDYPSPQDPVWPTDARPPGDETELQTVGPYDVATLAATDTAALAAWLDTNGFEYGSADLEAVRPYMELGWRVIAVRVHQETAVDSGALQPLSFTYPGSEMRLPLGISRQAGGGQLVLSVYIAAAGRYDLPEAYVPYAKRTSLGGTAFLTRNDLFADLSRGPDLDPIATRVPGDPQFHQENLREIEVRIPSSHCPPRDRDEDPICGCRTGGPRGLPDDLGMLLLFGLCVALLRRRR